MRVISWNMGAAFGPYVERHDEAWRHLESLAPDIALLQECIPAAWALRRWTVIKAPFDFWTTGIAVPAWKATAIEILPDNILARFRGFVAAAEVEVPELGPVLVVSAHASAHPASARTLRGLDAEVLRRPSVDRPWWNDLFFAGAIELVEGRRFIVGGDWNTARYVDADGVAAADGADFFARAAEAGWVDLHQAVVGHEERTWYGRRNPRAYMPDHVFADAETAATLRGARVDAEPAEARLSDHAPVIVEVDLPGVRSRAGAGSRAGEAGNREPSPVPSNLTQPSRTVPSDLGKGAHGMTDETRVRERVTEALATITPLVTMSRDGLVIGALDWGVAREPAYATATAAGRTGDLELREQGGGTVPSIEAVTKEKTVVIFAGDTVVGGKQNRIINVTVWLPAKAVTPIPVSCLEAGRWNQGYRFETSRKSDYLLRAKMSDQLASVALREQQMSASAPWGAPRRRSYAADQGGVWDEIAAKEERFGARSRSAALHDLYAGEADDIDAIVRAFPCPVGATGIAVGIGGRLVAVELFDAPSTLAEQWPRLVEGAASAWADHRRAVAAGVEPEPRHRHPDDGALGRMLARAAGAAATAVVGPSVGEGFDVRLAGTRLRGGALVVGDDVVHLELFRAEA